MRVKTISKGKAVDLINESKGRFINVTYTTNKGNVRVLNGNRASIQAHAKLGYITMFDAKIKDFRNVKAAGISGLVTNGAKYKVK